MTFYGYRLSIPEGYIYYKYEILPRSETGKGWGKAWCTQQLTLKHNGFGTPIISNLKKYELHENTRLMTYRRVIMPDYGKNEIIKIYHGFFSDYAHIDFDAPVRYD
jgi:hypothetical protein